jgi:hypothetical protein
MLPELQAALHQGDIAYAYRGGQAWHSMSHSKILQQESCKFELLVHHHHVTSSTDKSAEPGCWRISANSCLPDCHSAIVVFGGAQLSFRQLLCRPHAACLDSRSAVCPRQIVPENVEQQVCCLQEVKAHVVEAQAMVISTSCRLLQQQLLHARAVQAVQHDAC